MKKVLYLVSAVALVLSAPLAASRGKEKHDDMKACIEAAKADPKCAKMFKDKKLNDCADFFGGKEEAKEKCMDAWKTHDDKHADKAAHKDGEKHEGKKD